MGKSVTVIYTCDRCEEEKLLGELESVAAYCFSTEDIEPIALVLDFEANDEHKPPSDSSPKILDLTYVCGKCRAEFYNTLKIWFNK